MAPDERTQDLYRGEASGNVPSLPADYLHTSRLRYFGGTTNHWGGRCHPMEPIDFEPRDWVSDSGWPFSREHLLPYYRRAAEFMEMPAFDTRNPDAKDPRLPATLDSDLVEGRVSRLRMRRFGIEHRDEVVRSRRVRLVQHANAIAISATEQASAIDSIRVATLTGVRGTIGARVFVLAAGGIENPRLLLVSNDRQAQGLGNHHDLVGRYFMEHPVVLFGVGPLAIWPEFSLDLYCMHGDFRQQILFPREAVLRSRKMLTTSLLLQRHAAAPSEFMAGVARGAQREYIRPPDEFDRAVVSAAYDTDHLDGPAPSADSPGLFRTLFTCEQEPNPESRVALGDATDALGVRRAKLSWNLRGSEIRSIFEMIRLISRSVGERGLGRLQARVEPEALQAVLWQGFHHMGTTRMHEDPKRGVVDPDCRVHGIENLFVAGSSVFPTSGAANPTFTILALAIRLADHLRQRFGGAR